MQNHGGGSSLLDCNFIDRSVHVKEIDIISPGYYNTCFFFFRFFDILAKGCLGFRLGDIEENLPDWELIIIHTDIDLGQENCYWCYG